MYLKYYVFRLYNNANNKFRGLQDEINSNENKTECLKLFWRNCIKNCFFEPHESVIGGITADIMCDTPNEKRKIVHVSGVDGVTDLFHIALKNSLLKQQFIRREALLELSILLTAHLNDDEEELEYLHSIPGIVL